MDKLAAGFSTSEIRLWGLGDTILSRPRYKYPSVPLSCQSTPILEEVKEGEM